MKYLQRNKIQSETNDPLRHRPPKARVTGPERADFILQVELEDDVHTPCDGCRAKHALLGRPIAPLGIMMKADDGWFVGVAADVALSDNDFGWVRMKGSNFSGNVLASCAADAALYTSATAGSLDDASSSQTAIKGVVCVSAGSGGGKTAVEFIVPNGMRSTTF